MVNKVRSARNIKNRQAENERNYKEIIQGLPEDFRTFLKDLIEEG